MKHTVATLGGVAAIGLLLTPILAGAQISSEDEAAVVNSKEQTNVINSRKEQTFNVKVLAKEQNDIQSDFVGLTEQAEQLGFNEISLIGNAIEIDRDPSGVITYDIEWGTALHKPTNAITKLNRPFRTEGVKVQPDIEPNDVVTAKGIFDEIISVKDAILAQENVAKRDKDEENAEDEENADEESQSSSRASGSPLGNLSTAEKSEVDGFSPNFEEEVEPEPEDIVSSDGCDIVTNVTARTANQYKRIFRDGEPITSCAPSDEEFALTQDFSICSPSVQLPDGVFEQFTLGFQKKEDGSRTVIEGGKCFVDKSSPLPLTTNQCGFDVAEDDPLTYFQKEEVIYNHRGANVVARPCSRTEETFERQTNRTTCENQTNLESGTFTPFVFHFIVDEGEEIAVTGCVPDNENQQNLQTEQCTGGEKWFYDEENTGKAFLQGKFFYLDRDDNKKFVSSCEPRDQSFEVTFDKEGCLILHDDTNRRSRVQQKPVVILDENTLETEEIPGEECRDTGNFVPYTIQGGRWELKQDLGERGWLPANRRMTPTADTSVSGYVRRTVRNTNNNPFCADGPWRGSSEFFWCTNMRGSASSDILGEEWCVLNDMKEPFTIPSLNNAVLDKEFSDMDLKNPGMNVIEKGTISFLKDNIKNNNFGPNIYGLANNNTNGGRDNEIYYVCGDIAPDYREIRCPRVTKYEKKARFVRADGSAFIDQNNIIEDKFVCGFGSMLDGLVE